MRNLVRKARAYKALGYANLLKVAGYRASLKLGRNRAQRLAWPALSGAFFAPCPLPSLGVMPNQAWIDVGRYFGWWPLAVTNAAPHWHVNPVTGVAASGSKLPWWQIPDFDATLGDIKYVWEASRLDWVVTLAQAARNGDVQYLERLNHWLNDWVHNNSEYLGPNWKCGQEAAIRVMHLALAAIILGQEKKPTEALTELLAAHLQRIEPTLSYAMAQDNNHGTSEAAAMYIGGVWLAADPAGLWRNHASRWREAGRKLLEDRSARLIADDGSFSQHSVNYHRLMLDTMSLAELWRRRFDQPSFSNCHQERVRAAMSWLYAMTDPGTGDCPNLGANDGAQLLPLLCLDYRDYRPSVVLAATLFADARVFADSAAQEILQWTALATPDYELPLPSPRVYDAGGYALMRVKNARALFRYPRFRFRPAHADAMHVDFWLDGENVLRDGGSFSYNTEPQWQNYFPGTEAHNTVQFDGRDQMPKVGRFLYGEWLSTKSRSDFLNAEDCQSFSASYQDFKGALHQRHVTLTQQELTVVDDLSGFSVSAVLRWRLIPGEWQLVDGILSNGKIRISILSDVPMKRLQLLQGWESRYYGKKDPLPVLEVEIERDARITTRMSWPI